MKRIKAILLSHPAIHGYLSDSRLKAFASLVSSAAVNLLYAVWEILCGIYYHSYWFVTLGGYYLLLLMMRWMLLRDMRGGGSLEEKKWKRYRACGVLLLLLNLILSGIVVLAVVGHQGSRYAGYLIYAMAAYTFSKIGVAIRNLHRYRALHDPILAASKAISFASALISMLSLEIAMLLQFGTDEAFFRTMTVSTGTGFCVILSATALYMILTAQRALRTQDSLK
ncbi:MAG: hypothetical protein LIO78_03380 [Clostridiales bacterium]|nr:hypothetical protein [Clostridiales bacterium]